MTSKKSEGGTGRRLGLRKGGEGVPAPPKKLRARCCACTRTAAAAHNVNDSLLK